MKTWPTSLYHCKLNSCLTLVQRPFSLNKTNIQTNSISAKQAFNGDRVLVWLVWPLGWRTSCPITGQNSPEGDQYTCHGCLYQLLYVSWWVQLSLMLAPCHFLQGGMPSPRLVLGSGKVMGLIPIRDYI
jgi:hypothetical protein